MTELLPALHAALQDLTIVDKGRKAAAGSFSYAYADLGDVIKATRPVLAEHGLIALTPVHGLEDGQLAVTVSVYHVSGEALTFDPLPFPPGKDAQATGSAITYFRRYALLAALGMATGDDDDGGQATPTETADLSPVARKRLGHRVHNLNPQMRAALREWLDEQGLPDRAAQMTMAQCEAVNDWLDKASDGAS